MSETKQLELKIRKYSYVVRLDNGPKSAQMFEISDDSDMCWTALALDESRAKQIVTAVNFHERLVDALQLMSLELTCIHAAPGKASGMVPTSLVITSLGTQLLAKSAALLSEISKAAE